MKTVAISIFLQFTLLFALADVAPLHAKIENIPFRSCSGVGSNMMSTYANQKVTVNFNKNSVQIVNQAGKKKTYFSLSHLCNVDLKEFNVVCNSQVDEVTNNGKTYIYSKKCNVPIRGVPNRYSYSRLDLDIALNIYENNGKNSASGWLSCVADQDGFHGIDLSDCK